jgi:hypothetical protein
LDEFLEEGVCRLGAVLIYSKLSVLKSKRLLKAALSVTGIYFCYDEESEAKSSEVLISKPSLGFIFEILLTLERLRTADFLGED